MTDMEMVKVGARQKTALWNMLQKYLYEMTKYYDDAMAPDGNFPYRYFAAYFAGEPGREAFFFRSGQKVVGFAMINTHSFNGAAVDHCLAEFTIFPAFRHQGMASAAVKELFSARPGKWQLKYSAENETGMRFWQKVLSPCHPQEEKLDGAESLVSFVAG